MAGFHSFAYEDDTAIAAPNELAPWRDAKIAAFPSRQPCHATQTRPLESVAAAGKMSEPGSRVIRTGDPALPAATGRAHRSKLPLSFCDQNTQTRPEPSIAVAGRYKSPPGGATAI